MRNLNKNRRIYKGHSLVEDVGDYTVVDIETTSLDSFHGEILEISAIKVRNKEEVDNFSELIRTNEELGYFTTNLTGITNEMMLKEGKELEEVLQNFKTFLGNDIIVGHNVNFDINLSNDYVDTLRIARKVLPNLMHHKLDDLITYFHLTKRNEHRALNDCVLTNQVYIRLSKMI